MPNRESAGLSIWTVLLENGKMVALYGLGAGLIALLWWPLALVYLGYCVLSIFLFIALICPYCYNYHARVCPNAYHLVSIFKPKKGKGRTFADQFRRNVFVTFPGWFLPPIVGLYLLITEFSWLVLVLLVLFCVYGFVLFPYYSHRNCENCENAKNCPRREGMFAIFGQGNARDERSETMAVRIRQLVAPPVFEDDEEKTRIAGLLNTILFIVFGLVAVYTVISLATGIDPTGMIVEAMLLLVPVGLLLLVRRGHVWLASLILSLLLWGLITAGTYFYGGLQGSGPSSFFGVALIAGLLLGGRAALLFAALSVASLGGMLLAENLGIAPPPPDFITPTYRWMELSTTIVGVGGLFYLVTRSLEKALDRARRNEREAIEASNFKSRLIARVSHELRTPLGAILGLTEMMYCAVCGPLSPEQQEIAQKIIRNSHRLNRLVAELLDQSHFESGKLRLHMKEFSPRGVAVRVASTLTPLAESKGLTLRTDIADDLQDTVVGDPERVEQILYNLVDNAIKFTETGGVDVRLGPLDGEYWMMEVTDTGIGVSEEAREYIFAPFWQVDQSVTREHGGVGLGLTIVKELVMLMDGRIAVESRVGQGSKFTVVLPVGSKTEE